MNAKPVAATLFLFAFVSTQAYAQNKVPPYDMWTDDVLSAIRDRTTLDISVEPPSLSSNLFFTSNRSADWYESSPPYSVHHGEKIRIHAYLAVPGSGGPYPALVIGHGHGGQADPFLAFEVASLGYVALYIDGPQAGQSTGGPHDDNQAWISVDSGPQYGYLFHYAYAGMRALTALEELAARPGNPYRIDAQKLGVMGASMGGIFTTHINGVDSRVKAAIIMASAGNWQHTLRYPNSWLYHGIYTATRDLPYNGSDPLNSIEDIDTDPTAITFMNYFDPIRYAPRQYAPALTVIGTDDEYFPMPNANLMLQAITSAGVQPNFEKRLWLLPNAPHQFDKTISLVDIAASLKQWLEYCFGKREKPLATPQVALSRGSGGLRFEITFAETQARLAGAQVALYAATRVDSTATQIKDFKAYDAAFQGDRFVAQIPDGEKTFSGDVITADNVLYYATATDRLGLPVSSLMYKGALPMDLSTVFIPAIEQFPDDNVVAPLPPSYTDAAVTVASSLPVVADPAYQGMALTNATDKGVAVRVEARSPEGRLAAAEGLINPVFIPLPPRSQQVFLAEQWMGPGARRFNGSLQAGWSASRTDSLAFRGNAVPSELEGIGPVSAPSKSLWLPLAPEQDPNGERRIRIFSASSDPADVSIIYRSRFGGDPLETQAVKVAAKGTTDMLVSLGASPSEKASAEIRSSVPVSARLEVRGGKDPWSIDAQPAPTATKFIQPHLEWNGIFTTRLLMLNTSSTATPDVQLKLHTPSGTLAAPGVGQAMQKNGTTSVTIESLFGFSAVLDHGAGWLEVEVPNSQVVIVALAVDPNSGAAAASALLQGGTSSWSLPFFVENSGYWTGLALANGGGSTSIVSLTAYGRDGSILGRANADLNPQQSRTLLVHEWIKELAKEATGYILITSTAPIAPLAYFGTTDGASLAAIPFTPISP